MATSVIPKSLASDIDTLNSSFPVLLSSSSATTTIAAGGCEVITFTFNVPTGYTLVEAWDNSYLAKVLGVPIRIEGNTAAFNYYTINGVTSRALQCKALAVKLSS